MIGRVLCAAGLHEWSDWEQYEVEEVHTPFIGTSKVEVERRQSRKCKVCGYKQDQFVCSFVTSPQVQPAPKNT